MQNEISSGTMLGIVLIALAAVIGLGFGVFSIAKGVSNEGVVNVQDNLGTVSQSAFTDYDQKIVTGTQVVAAYKQFEGKSVAILVNTQAMTNGVKNLVTHEAYAVSLGNVQYLNYNALLASSSTGDTPTKLAVTGGVVVAGGSAILQHKDGIIKTGFGFATESGTGKVQFDTATGGFSKAGNCEYISTSAKFDANLIKDGSNQTVGVAFTQLAK